MATFVLFSDEHLFGIATTVVGALLGALLGLAVARLAGATLLPMKWRLRDLKRFRMAERDGAELSWEHWQEQVMEPAVVPSIPQSPSAHSRAPSPPSGLTAGHRTPGNEEWFPWVVGGTLLALAGAYLFYPSQVLLIIGAVTGFGLAFVTGAVAYLLRRQVMVGGAWTVFLLSAPAVVGVGLIDIWVLQHPSFHGGRYAVLFHDAQAHGLFSLLTRPGGGLLFVLYQMLGVAAFLAAVLLLLRAVSGLVARANVQLGSRPRWLWRLLFTLEVGNPVPVLLGTLVLAAASVPLAAGTAYNAVAVNRSTPRAVEGLRITHVRVEHGARRAHVSYRVNRTARVEIIVRRGTGEPLLRHVRRTGGARRDGFDLWLRRDHQAPAPGTYRVTIRVRRRNQRDARTVAFKIRR